MKRSHACLVAVVAATAWAAPVAPPRATLPPGPLSLGEACDRIGRQLNRRFEGGLLEQPELAAKVTPWKLQDAPAATAFAVLEEAALCHVNRRRGSAEAGG